MKKIKITQAKCKTRARSLFLIFLFLVVFCCTCLLENGWTRSTLLIARAAAPEAAPLPCRADRRLVASLAVIPVASGRLWPPNPLHSKTSRYFPLPSPPQPPLPHSSPHLPPPTRAPPLLIYIYITPEYNEH